MTYRDFLFFLSNIGDSAVLLAMTITGSLYLLALHRFREAAAVAAAFILSSSIISCLKLIFIGCGSGRYGIVSPSGHSALSVSVYGIFALLIYIRLNGISRFIVPLLPLGVAIMIAISRVEIQYHTASEVALGSFVGFTTLGTIWYFLLKNKRELVEARREPMIIRVFALPVLMLVTIYIMHGTSIPAEVKIKEIAAHIKEYISYCKE